MDIETRNIIDVVTVAHGDLLKVDIEIYQHPQRAMIGGQIEDLKQV